MTLLPLAFFPLRRRAIAAVTSYIRATCARIAITRTPMADSISVDAQAATFNIEGAPLLRRRATGDPLDVLPTGPGASVPTEAAAGDGDSNEDSKLVKLARDRTILAEERTQLIILQSIVGIMGFSVATSRVYITVGKRNEVANWEVVTWLWFAAAVLWFIVYAITEARFISRNMPWKSNEADETAPPVTNDTGCWTCAEIFSKCIRAVLCVLILVAMVFTMFAIRNDFTRK